MKHFILAMAIACAPLFASADAVPGQPAPAFEVSDADGNVHKLSDYKGKWVVLEWFNKECPYVKKHYNSNNMQTLQKEFTGKGVQWFTVISSAKGKQGYVTPAEAKKDGQTFKTAATAILLDSDGKVGKAYGAKTTPHMYVINPEGQLVYAGAIDDNNSSDPEVIPQSKNYVTAALTAAMENKKVEVASTKPYGCSVKY